jgi:tetratricopeptide (TPR) repeat protein
MTTIQTPFEIALGHERAGRLQQAADVCRQILVANPRHAQAMHLLATLALQTGDLDQAVSLLEGAIDLAPSEPAFHATLGQTLGARGEFEKAKESLARAIGLAPRSPRPYYSLAMAHRVQGEWQQARDCCRQALALDPQFHEAEDLLGDVLRHLGDRAAARACYERALAIKPDDFDAVINLATMARHDRDDERALRYFQRARELAPRSAEIPFYLGELEFARKEFPTAQRYFETSLALEPNSALAEAQLAAALHAQERRAEAVPHYQRATQLKPDFADAHYHLGMALDELDRESEAVEHFRRALEIEPGHDRAHLNLGAVFQRRGELAFAIEHFERALETTADSAAAHYNRAVILLSLGKFAAAWDDFEWRAKLPGFPMRAVSGPLWDGSPPRDKTLLLHAEQGLGDTLQFIRYLPMAIERCPRTLIQVQPQLLPLLEQAGFVGLVSADEPSPPCDYHAPLMSLPRLFGTTIENIPADIPYLAASPRLVQDWQVRLARLSGFRVGICWQGSRVNRADHVRSIPLEAFARLARVGGVEMVSLQKQERAAPPYEVPVGFKLHELDSGWDEAAGPFMDTAAVIENLHLVITADTATAHLAGALGVPVWVALSATPDWRWMLDREDSPWYPTMRLFRQARLGDWSELFERIASQLERQVSSGRSG